jgi:hypothetical protein
MSRDAQPFRILMFGFFATHCLGILLPRARPAQRWRAVMVEVEASLCG